MAGEVPAVEGRQGWVLAVQPAQAFLHQPGLQGLGRLVVPGQQCQRPQRIAQVLGHEQLAQQLQAEEDIDKSVFLHAAARYMQVDEPGLVKSAEQKKAEMDALMARQAQARAIDAVGTIAENRAKNQGVTSA